MVQLSLKLFLNPELSKNRRNSRFSTEKTIFLEFLELYFIFFHEILHTDAKWQCLKCDGVPFCKNFFSGRKYRKYAGKTGFWACYRDFIISFFSFFAQRCVLGCPKHGGVMSHRLIWSIPITGENFKSKALVVPLFRKMYMCIFRPVCKVPNTHGTKFFLPLTTFVRQIRLQEQISAKFTKPISQYVIL